MNIFSLAKRYLHVQRRRTVLTIVGVALAIALVAGTGLLISSFLNMRLKQATVESGSWHYQIDGADTLALANRLKSNVLFQKAGIEAKDTVLKIGEKGRASETIPLYEFDSAALSMMPDTITQGRFPKNGREVMLSTSAKALFSHVAIGDTITLPCGTLVPDGASGGSDGSADSTIFTAQNNGTFSEKSKRTFTVVGFFRKGLYEYQNIESAVTLNPVGEHTYSVYAQVKSGLNFPASAKKAAADCGIGKTNVHENGIVEWMGKSVSTKVKTAVITTFLILAAIILAITALVIRNSFAMSVADEISEIGTLRCLGAAPAHIRGLILSEGLCIWCIALPFGLLAGTGAMALVIQIVRSIDPSEFQFFSFLPAIWPYLLAAVLSLVAVLLSAFGPVHAAMRIPMVEAVRGNAIYQDSGIRRNRKGRLLGKLFGFPGMLAAKNIRRNPKRFRTTVLSVVVSAILFITIGGFALSIGNTLQTAWRQSGGMDCELSTGTGLSTGTAGTTDTVQALDETEKKIRGMAGIAAVQRTPVYFMSLQVPLSRVPQGYLELYREFSENSAKSETSSGKINQQLWMLEVSRENYSTLHFQGKAPTYDELKQSGGALLCQTSALFSSGGRFASAAFANYRSGEVLSVDQTVSPTEGKSETETFQVKVAGLLSELPWFSEQVDGGVLVFPEGGTERFHTEAVKKAAAEHETMDSEISLAIRYAKGAEKQVDEQIRQMMPAIYKNGLGFHDVYQSTINMKNSYLVMLIFIGGFTLIVILISCINLFNTVHANLQTRRREIAMTRAIGMNQSQLRRMLLLECSLYGIIGTLWGTVIGLPLQFLLLKAFHTIISANMQAPLLMALLALLITSGIGILAGMSSIRRMVKEPIVEEIRAEE